MSKGLSIKDISGRNFLLSKYPIIELAVVNETGPDLDGCLENLKYQLEEYLVQVAETIIDNQIGWKIIEFIEQNNMVGGKVLKIKKELTIVSSYQVDGNDLFSRAVSSQISSTCESLTFVFGMGTSGTSQL